MIGIDVAAQPISVMNSRRLIDLKSPSQGIVAGRLGGLKMADARDIRVAVKNDEVRLTPIADITAETRSAVSTRLDSGRFRVGYCRT